MKYTPKTQNPGGHGGTAPTEIVFVLHLAEKRWGASHFCKYIPGAKHSGTKSLVLTNNLSAGMLRPYYKIGMLPSAVYPNHLGVCYS